MGWLATVPCATLIAATVSHIVALQAISVAAAAFGIWIFWTHAGRYISAVGIYSLAMAVFAGYAGWSNATRRPDHIRWIDVLAILLIYSTHVLTWLLFWRSSDQPFGEGQPRYIAPSVRKWGISVGVALMVVGAFLGGTFGSLGPLPQSAAFVGTLIAGTAVITERKQRQPNPLRVMAGAAFFAAYVAIMFNGGGRLVIAGLGITLAMATSGSFPDRRVKFALVASILPALFIFGSIRADGVYIRTVDEGLGSAVEPLAVFGDVILLERDGGVQPFHGSTFAVSLVAQVPGALWESKPAGFGTVLTEYFKPHQLQTGHSMAALSHGEWWWNFGWLGMILMIPATGVVLRWGDKLLARAYSKPSRTPRDLLHLAFAATLASGLLDYFWVGSFTYAARTVTRLLVTAGLVLVVTATHKRSSSTSDAVDAGSPLAP